MDSHDKSHSGLTAYWQKVIIKTQMLSSIVNVRYQETASIMWLFNHVRCRSKHTKNFGDNSQVLMSRMWHDLKGVGDFSTSAYDYQLT
tara:strand:- start:1804 stop:2067 length:264 start_codon:yes stop_codon:yes gene_type:complete